MRRTAKAILFPTVIVLLGILVFADIVAAQETAGTPDSQTKTAPETTDKVFHLAAHETSLIVIVLTVVILAGGMITGLLMRLGLAKSFIWILPIMTVLAGAAWGAIAMHGAGEAPGLLQFGKFLFTFLAYVCVLWLVTRLAFPSAERRTRGGLPPLLRGMIVLVLAFAGLLVLLQRAFPSVNLTPLPLTSGALSIVVGLALKDLLENLIAGIVLSIQRPFNVGDWIQISDTEGEIAAINWRTTVIRTRRNDHVQIPNNVVMREKTTNFDHPGPLHRRYIHVGVTYATPPGVAVRALLEAAGRVEGVLQSPPPEAHFLDYADSSLVYQLRVWIDNYASMPEIESDVRKAVWYSFKRHGITIPFPQRDVHLQQVQDITQTCCARLIATSGLPRGTVFILEKPNTTIGREAHNDIVLIDPRVSNTHAEIKCKGNEHIIRDLDSSHSTLLNGQAVTSSVLAQGDEIMIGSILLTYESNLIPQKERKPK